MNAKQKFRDRVFRDPAYFVAAGFGSGLLPKAPGTWGALVGMVIYVLALRPLSLPVYGAVVASAFFLGVIVSGRVTRQLGVEDHQGIVWDEVVGVWVTMAFVPGLLAGDLAVPGSEWLWIVAGFVLFRVFDIVKPWPIRSLEQGVRGGWGVMLDDVLAGVYAGVVLLIAMAGARAALASLT